jgi:hypothetical protein
VIFIPAYCLVRKPAEALTEIVTRAAFILVTTTFRLEWLASE